MKILVSTNGQFMLRSQITGDEVAWNRASLVRNCNFLQTKIADGSVKLHATDIPDTATDAEWAEWLVASDGNESLAIESFVSQFADHAMEKPAAVE